MNKRGQALIEFVLILPVLLLTIFAFIDFGRIILCRMHLEGSMNQIVNLYKEDKNKIDDYLQKDKGYKIKYSILEDDYQKIILETDLDLITPGIKNILNNPYKVSVERSIL